MEEMIFCQSCGMPMTEQEHFGTNEDKSKNDTYCVYCFQKGKFSQDFTMDEMIEHCLQFLGEFNKDSKQKLSKAQAKSQMMEYFPDLKRWKS